MVIIVIAVLVLWAVGYAANKISIAIAAGKSGTKPRDIRKARAIKHELKGSIK
jgi:hypothetical protein